VEPVREDYESSAMSLGQAIYLTHFLNDIADEIQKLEYFLPADDVDALQVDLKRHNPARPSPPMLGLMHSLVQRIEQLYRDGGVLVNYLSLDGQRAIRSLVDVSWDLLMKIKREPQTAFLDSIQLTQKEWLKYRWKHLMGLEGGVEVLSRGSGPDHH
jgi:phytoene/squalene synthetase